MDNSAVRLDQGQVLALFVEGEAGMETPPLVDVVARGPVPRRRRPGIPGQSATSPWERTISADCSGRRSDTSRPERPILDSPLYSSIQSEELPSPSSISPGSRGARLPLEAMNSLITTDETPGSSTTGGSSSGWSRLSSIRAFMTKKACAVLRERLGVEGQGHQMQSVRDDRSLELRHRLDRNVAVGDIEALGGLDAAGIGDRHVEEARLVQGIVMVRRPGVPARGQAA